MRFAEWAELSARRIPCPGGHWTRLPRDYATAAVVWMCTHKAHPLNPLETPCGRLLIVRRDSAQGRKLIAEVSASDLRALRNLSEREQIDYLLSGCAAERASVTCSHNPTCRDGAAS